MRVGHASKTAVLVCMGRAVAHGRTSAPMFSDPTALALLPDDARVLVERYRSGRAPEGVGQRVAFQYLRGQELVMVARTVAIDEAIRGGPRRQLVILGAGLDGRAYRMAELSDAVVFEVDHPDSQRDKRGRTTALTPVAREVRFVPVDFTRDSLDAALERAGHVRGTPTTWVWEGVIPYLTRERVESTLDVVAGRSQAGSRLVLTYQSPALSRRLLGFLVAWLGEAFRSSFTSEQMRVLLERRGFVRRSDDAIAALGAVVGVDFRAMRFWLRSGRIAVVDRDR
jgi:methyltransferase (TIGR00027 family)